MRIFFLILMLLSSSALGQITKYVCTPYSTVPGCGGGSSSGINWNQIGGIQGSVGVSGFNWQNLSGINTTGINWSNINFSNVGSLGIGGSPIKKLTVIDATTLLSSYGGNFVIANSANTNYQMIFGYDTAANASWIQSAKQGTAVTPIYLNPNNGGVIINSNISGVSGYSLTSSGSGNYGNFALENTANTGYSGINMYDTGNTLAASFQYGNSSASPYPNTFFFGTRESGGIVDILSGAGVVANTILANGNNGINITTPTHKLEVNGNGYFNGLLSPAGGVNWTGINNISSSNINWTSFPASGFAKWNGSSTPTADTNIYATTAKTEQTISYQPGLLSAINSTIGVYGQFANASTVDNIVGSAVTFSCIANPTITMYECGVSTTCTSPTTIGTVTVTSAGTAFPGTISSSAITSGDYVGWAITSGTCASIDIAGTAQIHSN